MHLLVAFVCIAAHCLTHGSQAAILVPRNGVRPKHLISDDELYRVPEDLLIGAGLSSSQSEGAWKTDGKSESVMDYLVHIKNSSFPDVLDVAADHYNKYAEDLALAKELKFTTHRFSISWSRIFPDGNSSNPRTSGVEFYRKYIQEILKNGMEPMVTMYHFDHPLVVETETKGWTNEKMVEKFVEYANFLFSSYGSMVKYWNPVNEGNMYCIYLLPLLNASGLSRTDASSYYKCIHNTVLAQVRVHKLYKEKYYNPEQDGKVGTSVLVWPSTPATDSYEDALAATTFNDFFGGIMVHPVVFGDYPSSVRHLVDKQSREMNMTTSRLPSFHGEDKLYIEKGPATDFVALNVYSGFKLQYTRNYTDYGFRPFMIEPSIEDMPFVRVNGIRSDYDENVIKDGLLWAWNTYQQPIIITESGLFDRNGVHDSRREAYHSLVLRSLIRTMNEYEIPVISYHAWSLIDVFEFSGGYTGRPYGLIHVDYANKTLKRTLKDSSRFFIKMATDKIVPYIAPPSADTTSTSTSVPSTTPSATSRSASMSYLAMICALSILFKHPVV
ncbi:hypothetical protein ONE63_000170 [Megalurothrips usitatus]|uniref:Myrosinase 1-like n=1 Tax=Megalurothrips usitatus TaxID=439358 RepID=A0AAV7Y3R8_9NEOP|nr:hypothetical protein ONE63_000170 [Megalurothrips usitatus]